MIVAVGTGTGPNPTTVGITPPPSQSPSSPAGLTASPSASSTPPAAQALLHTIAQLQRKRAADPDDVTVLLALGRRRFCRQRYRAAAQAYQRPSSSSRANATASVRLAMVWHAEGQSEQAMKAIKAVHRPDPCRPGSPLLSGHRLLLPESAPPTPAVSGPRPTASTPRPSSDAPQRASSNCWTAPKRQSPAPTGISHRGRANVW